MQKPTCRHCGKELPTAGLMVMHEGKCPQNPEAANHRYAPVVVTAPAPPPVTELQPVLTQAEMNERAEANQRGYEILRSGDHELAPDEDAVQVIPASNGLSVPEVNPMFVIPNDLARLLERTERRSRRFPEKPARKLCFTGPQGSGKTSLAEQFAAVYQRPFYAVPCVTMQEPQQWWGMHQVSLERGTYYVPSMFVKAIETPFAVICLDDMNRVENPKVLNPLFPLLDDRGMTHIDDLGRTVKVAEGIVFFGTVNEGWEFQGTDPIDAALNDRFKKIKIGYPPPHTIEQIITARVPGLGQDQIRLISSLASSLATLEREDERIYLSMRQNILIAEDLADEADMSEAVKFTFLANLSPEQTQHALSVLQMLMAEGYTAVEPKWERWG